MHGSMAGAGPLSPAVQDGSGRGRPPGRRLCRTARRHLPAAVQPVRCAAVAAAGIMSIRDAARRGTTAPDIFPRDRT